MAQTEVHSLTVRLTAQTGLALAFVRLVSIPVLFGWKPGEATENRLAGFATRLIRVKVTPGSTRPHVSRRGNPLYDPRCQA